MEEPDFSRLFRAIGARLRTLRDKRRLTQEDMISFGFSARHWQQVEAGRPITVKTLVRAALALEVSPSSLLVGLESELPVVDEPGHVHGRRRSRR